MNSRILILAGIFAVAAAGIFFWQAGDAGDTAHQHDVADLSHDETPAPEVIGD